MYHKSSLKIYIYRSERLTTWRVLYLNCSYPLDAKVSFTEHITHYRQQWKADMLINNNTYN